MNKKMSKRQRDIKSKLMAAICMLLVSSIMMVSSTYAWFTLSTAPEVTGINTAVGANGNLEMALLPADASTKGIDNDYGITTDVNDSTKPIAERNVTWGNLVDLSDKTVYGLDKITLFPSALNAASFDEQGNPATLAAALLKTPQYGADGRVSQLAENTLTGLYDTSEKIFTPQDGVMGVRAVGTASGMTPRQLDYRNARSAANTARSQASTLAAQSLNTNGSALANIAIEYGMNSASATFGASDVASLRAIVDGLQGEGGVFDQIETAYIQYILAYAASAATGTEDTKWSAIKGEISKSETTLASLLTFLETQSVTLPAELSTAIAQYNGANGMVAKVATSDSKLAAMEATLETNSDATFTWAQIREAMEPLANPDAMLINGFKANEVKENLGDLVSSVTSQGGLKVILASGAGVYADIADQCGDFNASVNIERVEYNGIVLNNMNARMETASTVKPSHLEKVGLAVENAKAPASGAVGTMPITDMYGYVIDMAFRTNAADSKLQLQVQPTDRIYSDNTNDQTMGHGASMTFAATTTDFSNDQVKELMKAIRIVFFDPMDGQKIVANAKLDVTNAKLEADGWRAFLYLYDPTAAGVEYVGATYDAASGEKYFTRTETTEYTEITLSADQFENNRPSNLYVKYEGTEGGDPTYTAVQAGDTYNGDNVYCTAETTYSYFEYTASEAPAAGTQLYIKKDVPAGEIARTNTELMPLTQNTVHTLSVLVYLDGNVVGNDDVAATASTSMTGKMNLQFSSTAGLIPMEYADLHTPGAAETTAPSESTGENP